MTTDVSIDIETINSTTDAGVLSIGACAYVRKNNGKSAELELRTFYIAISPHDAFKVGSFGVDTLLWWNKQSDAARSNAFVGTATTEFALRNLRDWFDDVRELDDNLAVWANAPTFDCSILRHHYNALGIPTPWNFWEERCFRTIKDLALNIGYSLGSRKGTYHNALDDAKYQHSEMQAMRHFISKGL